MFFKRVLSRLALIAAGIALGLLGLEIVLQLAAPLLRPGLRPVDVGAPSQGALRVLCVGDSHTFGIWVEPDETYPARLQGKLAGKGREFTVLNAGVPGMNSTQVRDALPSMLDSFQPSVVLLMVGVADFWNLTALSTDSYQGWRWFLRGGGLWDKSRVVKLARLIRFNLRYGRDTLPPSSPVVEHTPFNWKIHGGAEEVDVDIDMHFEDGLHDIVVFRRLLRRDLSVIASQIQAKRITLVLMTYPTDSGLYAAVNEVYRQFAESSGLPLIDLAAQMTELAKPPLAEGAFFPDFHPRAPAYDVAAGIIAARLVAWFTPAAPDS